ncbi:MAG: HemK family protein methyltransferase [Bdellovibrionaceae bacterium]|nr:HemK family protein methyltransferase [Pseudobdellovibrionaceae bacterium]
MERAPESQWIADFGCGSGCIGLSLLKEIPGSRLIAVDRSKVAAEVTRENSIKLNLLERVEVVEQSVENWNAPRMLDLIVMNPPYIAEGDVRVQASVHTFEPHEALYAADEGLAAIAAWTRKAWATLRPSGAVVLEIGSGQSGRVQEIMRQTGFREIQIARDLNGIERVISGNKPE